MSSFNLAVRRAFLELTPLEVWVGLLFLLGVIFLAWAFLLRRALQQERERVRATEAHFRALVERLPVGIFRATVDGDVLTCNPAAAKIFGFPDQKAMMAASVWNLYPDPKERGKLIESLRLQKHLPAHQVLLRRVDGEPVWVLRDLILEIENGQEVLEGILMDWSQARKAEEEARLLVHALRSISDCVSITDRENCLLFVNEAFCETYGYQREEVLGKNISLVRLPDAPGPTLEQILEATLAGGFSGEVWNLKRTGEPLLMQLKTSVVKDEQGFPLALIGVARDITLERKQEEALRQAQKLELLGTLVGSIAHDFNNILQAQLSLVQMLIKQKREAGLCPEELGQLEVLINRGSALCRKLLLFARKGKEHRSPLDLNCLLEEELSFLARLLPENIRLVLELRGEQAVVNGNWQQLSQVFMNLVLNAKDAMPSGGVLAVSSREEQDRVGFEVADTGVGIAEEARRHLFEPFFTTKAAGQGTGLGLSVVHGIVAAHGGKVEVESEVGKGTRFRLWLPKANETSLSLHPAREEAPPLPTGHGQWVLLVEDEPLAREALARALQEIGYQVQAVTSGEEALTFEGLNRVAVLVTDFGLPGINGLELGGKLHSRYPGLKIVLMSGYDQSTVVTPSSLEGSLVFLNKPFPLWELANTLQQLTLN